jgi:tetratricopeptide (TPR) repeat protein
VILRSILISSSIHNSPINVTNSPAPHPPAAENVPDHISKIQALIAQSAYDQAIEQCQGLIEAEPAIKAYYWYLGLALLLLGQEAEAQMVWLEAIDTIEPEQLEQWSVQLWQVLKTGGDRRTQLLLDLVQQQPNSGQLEPGQDVADSLAAGSAIDPEFIAQEQQSSGRFGNTCAS